MELAAERKNHCLAHIALDFRGIGSIAVHVDGPSWVAAPPGPERGLWQCKHREWRDADPEERRQADHWCDLGHVLYVVEGELDTELRDGRTFKLRPGMSYQVSDRGDAAHRRSSTQTGIKLFIID